MPCSIKERITLLQTSGEKKRKGPKQNLALRRHQLRDDIKELQVKLSQQPTVPTASSSHLALPIMDADGGAVTCTVDVKNAKDKRKGGREKELRRITRIMQASHNLCSVRSLRAGQRATWWMVLQEKWIRCRCTIVAEQSTSLTFESTKRANHCRQGTWTNLKARSRRRFWLSAHYNCCQKSIFAIKRVTL